MGALLPLLASAAEPALIAGATAAAKGLGDTLGSGVGRTAAGVVQGVVDAAGNAVNAITSFGQPKGAGQQQFMYMASQPPYYR